MDISIGSNKVRVEILVAIVVVFWIMFGHLLCGCCRMNLFEGFREGMTTAQRFKGKLISVSNEIIRLTPGNDNQKKAKSALEKLMTKILPEI